MPYESFKKALIAEFETTRDLEVTKSNYPKYDTLFSLSDAKDKLYNTILDKFEKIAICNSENLIYELCQKHDVFYERNMGNRENYDFEIEIAGVKRKVDIKTRPNMSVINHYKSKIPTADFMIVFLLRDGLETRKSLEIFRKHCYSSKIACECVLLEDLIEDAFGEEEKNCFLHVMSTFKAEMRKVIGYQVTELCTSENFLKFKDEVENILLQFDYQKVCDDNFKKVLEEDVVLQLKEKNYNKIYKQFITRKYYKVLLSDKDFATSFLTSEWLLHKYGSNECLDNTYIVAGYLKSIEQLLWDIIYLTGENVKKFKTKNSAVLPYMDINVQNAPDFDKTLGALENYLNFKGNRVSSGNQDLYVGFSSGAIAYVMDYLKAQIKYWRENHRNGYFHLDDLKNVEGIYEIREQTIYLYFLIIGSLKFDRIKLENMVTQL